MCCSVYLAVATVAYLVLPLDWMGEYRFATAFLVFLYWSLGEMLHALQEVEPSPPGLRWVVAAFAALFLATTCLNYGERSRNFAQTPVVPFGRVAAFSGTGYNRLAAILGTPDASLLTPDLGGTLFYSTLRVYDLAGLCDRVVALTLRHDHPAFLDYVFEAGASDLHPRPRELGRVGGLPRRSPPGPRLRGHLRAVGRSGGMAGPRLAPAPVVCRLRSTGRPGPANARS